MIAKTIERERAIALRKQGHSLREIIEKVPVAKSTLSVWLREVGLSVPQKQRLTQKKLDAARRGAQKKKAARILKSASIRSDAMAGVDQFYSDIFWLSGVMLYWAEGAKEKSWRCGGRVSFTNMDWKMVLIFRDWLVRYLSLDSNDLDFSLYLHKGCDRSGILTFWARKLNIREREIKVYLKSSKRYTQRKNVEDAYKGVFRVRVRKSVDLNRKISGWIDGMTHYLLPV